MSKDPMSAEEARDKLLSQCEHLDPELIEELRSYVPGEEDKPVVDPLDPYNDLGLSARLHVRRTAIPLEDYLQDFAAAARKILEDRPDEPGAGDATDILWWIDRLRGHIRDKDAEQAARAALHIGSLVRQLGAWPFYPSFLRDQGSQGGRARGGATTAEKHEPLHAKFQQIADAVRRERPHIKSKIGIARIVSQRIGKNPTTKKPYSPDRIARTITLP